MLPTVHIESYDLCPGTADCIRDAYGLGCSITTTGYGVGKVVAATQREGNDFHADITLLRLFLACCRICRCCFHIYISSTGKQIFAYIEVITTFADFLNGIAVCGC